MISININITAVEQGGNEFGAAVEVLSAVPVNSPFGEGATLVGICTAINDYMRSRGCPNFDCLKLLGRH